MTTKTASPASENKNLENLLALRSLSLELVNEDTLKVPVDFEIWALFHLYPVRDQGW